MGSRITCRVDERLPVALVRLSGVLDVTTMAEVHRELRDTLATQPDALVVDLTEVEVRDRLALAVFAAISREAASWPGVPVVLCPPAGEPAPGLAEATNCRVVAVRSECAAAVRDSGRRAPRLRARLAPVADACRWARELATDACQRWNLPDLVGPLCLILSELVGNVVRHAGTPMDVTLTLRRPYLHVAVADGSGRVPSPACPGPRVEGGRGLLLVRELAQQWGSLPLADGKVVWATLPAR